MDDFLIAAGFGVILLCAGLSLAAIMFLGSLGDAKRMEAEAMLLTAQASASVTNNITL